MLQCTTVGDGCRHRPGRWFIEEVARTIEYASSESNKCFPLFSELRLQVSYILVTSRHPILGKRTVMQASWLHNIALENNSSRWSLITFGMRQLSGSSEGQKGQGQHR